MHRVSLAILRGVVVVALGSLFMPLARAQVPITAAEQQALQRRLDCELDIGRAEQSTEAARQSGQWVDVVKAWQWNQRNCAEFLSPADQRMIQEATAALPPPAPPPRAAPAEVPAAEAGDDNVPEPTGVQMANLGTGPNIYCESFKRAFIKAVRAVKENKPTADTIKGQISQLEEMRFSRKASLCTAVEQGKFAAIVEEVAAQKHRELRQLATTTAKKAPTKKTSAAAQQETGDRTTQAMLQEYQRLPPAQRQALWDSLIVQIRAKLARKAECDQTGKCKAEPLNDVETNALATDMALRAQKRDKEQHTPSASATGRECGANPPVVAVGIPYPVMLYWKAHKMPDAGSVECGPPYVTDTCWHSVCCYTVDSVRRITSFTMTATKVIEANEQ